MNPLFAVAFAVLWAAAGHRLYVARRRPAPWRTALAVSMTALACAATGHFIRLPLDAALGVPNVTNLGSRIALCVSVMAAQIYLLGSRRLTGPTTRRIVIVAAGTLTIAVSVIAWIRAPIHGIELADLAGAPRHPASLVYAVTIYLYVGWFLIGLTRYAAANYASLRRSDPPAAAAAAFIVAAGWTGVPVLALFTVHSTLTQTTGVTWNVLDTLASALFPIPLALFAAGMLLLPLLPFFADRRASTQLTTQLTPLWRAVVQQHPHVRLPLHDSAAARHLKPGLLAHRQLIEISDALEEHHVPQPETMSALVAALHEPQTPHGVNAKDALLAIDHSPWPQPLLHLSDAVARERTVRR